MIATTEDPSQLGAGRPTARSDVAAAVALVVLTLAVYGQVLRHEFVNFDDDKYVYENPTVLRGLHVDGALWAFTTNHVHNWHPLTWLSHMADAQAYGAWPGGHHLTSVLLHAANAVLLYTLLVRTTGRRVAALFVALLFAVHPQRVESVAWVSERKDVLSAFFFLISLAAYVSYVRRRGTARYLALVGAFAAGLMSKQMLVTLPFLLLLLDVWPLRRVSFDAAPPLAAPGRPVDSWVWLLIEKAPLLALSAAFSVVVYVVQSRTGVVKNLGTYPLANRLGNAVVSYGIYLRQMLWPTDLAAFYPHPGESLSSALVWACTILLVVITALACLQRRSRPYLLTGWLWYVGMLVPVIGLVQVGLQARADRYTYLPTIGALIALVWLVSDAVRGRRCLRVAAVCVGTVMAALLLLQSYVLAATWRSNESLYARVIATQPPHPWPHLGLAAARYAKGDLEGAERQFEEALRLDPRQIDALYGLGVIHADRGEYEGAVGRFREALALDPAFLDTQYQLGVCLLELRRVDQAVASLLEAVTQRPHDAHAYSALGVALASSGRVDDARRALQEALRLDPGLDDARRNLTLLD